MKKLLNDINKLTKEELERANENFPQFASAHEGYAVLLEETEETKYEVEQLDVEMRCLWKHIKRNIDIDNLGDIKSCATHLAAESIQVAAMAQKFIDMREREGK